MALPAHAETVVIGAGSAGAVIASRVTEDPSREVLLLEAGPDHPDPARLPEDLADGRRNSMRHHDWGFRHRPTTQQIRFPFPRGRVVGGSSAVNTCIALRGNPYDFDRWAERGLPEWSWDECLPAFRRLERDLDPWTDDRWHGRDGPLPLRRARPGELVPWQAGFVEACRELGYPACDDTNDPTTTGVGPHAMNRIGDRRVSAAEAWLTPAVRARDNLRIVGGAHVVRVVFEGRRATGVMVEHDGAEHLVRADRVVLSAGAVLTPAILQRSGIGPRGELERLGVDVVHDLPAVGARLLDHPGCAFFLRPRRGVARASDPLIQTVARYQAAGSPFPNDMQIQPGSNVALRLPFVPMISIMAAIGKPRGHGRWRLPSADPHAKPELDAQLLEDPVDRARAVEAMERAYAISETSTMRDLATHLWPGPRILGDGEAIDGWIRRATDSGYHPCGTVPMGAEDDPDAACDGRGRVRGVEGLVVADASLMPEVPSSNTNLPTLMIGERFGDWLRVPPA